MFGIWGYSSHEDSMDPIPFPPGCSFLPMYSSDDDYLDHLPPGFSFPRSPVRHEPYNDEDVQKRVDALKRLQKQYDALTAKCLAEGIAGLPKADIKTQYADLYLKRFNIVNGVADVDDIKSQNSEKTPIHEIEEVKGIPDFWLTALQHGLNSDCVEITEADEKSLTFLKDIRVKDIENLKEFTLEFLFDCNPYFRNSVLTKTYILLKKQKKFYITKSIGPTEIEWYPGQNPMKTMERMRPKRGSQDTKPIVKYESCESFFHYLKTREGRPYLLKDDIINSKCTVDEGDGDGSNDEDDGRWFGKGNIDEINDDASTDSYDDDEDETEEEIEQEFMEWEDDCKIGCMIRSKIVPEAVFCYLDDVQLYRDPYGSWFGDDDDIGDWSSDSHDKCVASCSEIPLEHSPSKPEVPKAKKSKTTGVVKCYCSWKGYGLVTPDNGGGDIFIHHNLIKYFKTLTKGDLVEYKLRIGADGTLKAFYVKKLDRSCISDGNGRERGRGISSECCGLYLGDIEGGWSCEEGDSKSSKCRQGGHQAKDCHPVKKVPN